MVSLICPVEQTGRVLFVNLQLFTGEACLHRECASDSRVVLGGGGQSLEFPAEQPPNCTVVPRDRRHASPARPGLPSAFAFLETLEAFGCDPMGRGRGGICPGDSGDHPTYVLQ